MMKESLFALRTSLNDTFGLVQAEGMSVTEAVMLDLALRECETSFWECSDCGVKDNTMTSEGMHTLHTVATISNAT